MDDLVIPDENGARFLQQRSLPIDPWGYEYRYDLPFTGEPFPMVYTLGADNEPGGERENADISNWQLLGGE